MSRLSWGAARCPGPAHGSPASPGARHGAHAMGHMPLPHVGPGTRCQHRAGHSLTHDLPSTAPQRRTPRTAGSAGTLPHRSRSAGTLPTLQPGGRAGDAPASPRTQDLHRAARQAASVGAPRLGTATASPLPKRAQAGAGSRRDRFHSKMTWGVTMPAAPRRAAASRTPTLAHITMRTRPAGSTLTPLRHVAPPSTSTSQPWAASGEMGQLRGDAHRGTRCHPARSHPPNHRAGFKALHRCAENAPANDRDGSGGGALQPGQGRPRCPR